jgi:hypothetical protein
MRLPWELIVHVLACLAEGLGIRATARVFEVDANWPSENDAVTSGKVPLYSFMYQ